MSSEPVRSAPTLSAPICTVGQYSDRGVKEENQDSYGVLLPTDSRLEYKGIAMVIADGVSGSEQGKLASETCVKSLLFDYYATADSWTVKTSVEKVLLATNRWLCGQASQSAELHRGLASTLSALVVKSTTAHLFHVGDTRIYRLRAGALELLTVDHRFWASREKNYLTRALGIDARVEIDYTKFPVERGDTFIFTTDGVHEHVTDRLIHELVAAHPDNLDRAARELATRALQNGSPDNVTCQIVRFDALPAVADADVFRRLTELPFPPDLAAGMKIDGYRILREIHASKRTQVYVALDEASGTQVVIKTPSANFSDDPVYLDLFRHEEWVGSRVQSNHVLRVVGQERPRQFFYYVTEYVDGQTLRGWMHDHLEPDLGAVRQIIGQCARGLAAFHRMEMIHQDLKPENIMIDTEGTVKIIDFGSTKIAGIEEIASPIERLQLLGTKNYTAPEYLQGYPCSARSDIFSLGVIAYEMITGHLPYGEKYDETRLGRIEYIPARRWVPELPAWVDRALEKSLSLTMERRYAEVSEFVFDLCNPSAEFANEARRPLLERDPLGFWRGLAILSLLLNLALGLWMLRG